MAKVRPGLNLQSFTLPLTGLGQWTPDVYTIFYIDVCVQNDAKNRFKAQNKLASVQGCIWQVKNARIAELDALLAAQAAQSRFLAARSLAHFRPACSCPENAEDDLVMGQYGMMTTMAQYVYVNIH